MKRGFRVVAVVLVLGAPGCASVADPATAPSATAPTSSGSVRIAPDVYAVNRYGNSNETILVRGSFDRAKGVAVLRHVAARFFLVDETGVEHASEADFPPEAADGTELYTPNYVADPEIRPDGIRLYVDCKAAIEPPMRQTFLRILRDELAVLGDVTVVNAG